MRSFNSPLAPGKRSGFALPQAGGLAFETAQVIQFGSPDSPGAHHVNVIHYRRVQREDALDALAKADFANGNRLAQALVIARDDGSFERLQPFLIAFLDFHVHPNRVTGPKLRMPAPQV